jgi:tRNASer (uridine44-2'-O)-methyltransferase
MEGYNGIGLDIRARKSWKIYPQSTQARLHAYALNPLDADFPPNRFFPQGVFVIGNHADELSPWLAITASLVDNAAFISIPCCPWSLDQKFHRNASVYPPLSLGGNEDLQRRLGDTVKSTYGSYVCWLSSLARECGFEVEYEALRIPSTRNWSIMGELMDVFHKYD